MKKVSLLLTLFAFIGVVSAQNPHQVNSFFEPNGMVRLETQELALASDSLVTIQHRAEDVVWRRDIYRIIDMRQKQNFQLYFPVMPDDPTYWSLYRLVLDAVSNGLTIYRPDQYVIKPTFSPDRIIPKKEVPDYFMTGTWADLDREDPDTYLLQYDSATQVLTPNFTRYENYVRNQVKFLVQEVVFFNKHTSRLYKKIIAIAPLQPDMASGDDENPSEFMRSSIKFWMLFDELRPWLAKRYMIPTQNEQKRVTFDEFFQKRLFTSYIIGESNMYNRMILDYCKTEVEAKREQARIESELLTFEQDLWEY
ncbi:MAG: gliding motility protein GldN [Paludibacteraceae bacterium]|nr:gliding motility protein GldN [Paludibacteraceae bacterium]